MRRLLHIALLLVGGLQAASAQLEVTEFVGVNQGELVFIDNPWVDEVGHSIFKIHVNGEHVNEVVSSGNRIAMMLDSYGIPKGDSVVISLSHVPNVPPKLWNPEALQPQCACNFVDLFLDDDGVMHWTLNEEVNNLPLRIKQKFNTQYGNAVTVDSKGAGTNRYSAEVGRFDGVNEYVIEKGRGKNRCASDTIRKTFELPDIEVDYDRAAKAIDISQPVAWRLWDAYGNLAMRGRGPRADVSKMKRGLYYFEFANEIVQLRLTHR